MQLPLRHPVGQRIRQSGPGSAFRPHYTNLQLDETAHSWELEPLPETVVSLDYRYTALAESDRIAAKEPDYYLDEKVLSFGFKIKPVQMGAVDPFDEIRK